MSQQQLYNLYPWYGEISFLSYLSRKQWDEDYIFHDCYVFIVYKYCSLSSYLQQPTVCLNYNDQSRPDFIKLRTSSCQVFLLFVSLQLKYENMILLRVTNTSKILLVDFSLFRVCRLMDKTREWRELNSLLSRELLTRRNNNYFT